MADTTYNYTQYWVCLRQQILVFQEENCAKTMVESILFCTFCGYQCGWNVKKENKSNIFANLLKNIALLMHYIIPQRFFFYRHLSICQCSIIFTAYQWCNLLAVNCVKPTWMILQKSFEIYFIIVLFSLLS